MTQLRMLKMDGLLGGFYLRHAAAWLQRAGQAGAGHSRPAAGAAGRAGCRCWRSAWRSSFGELGPRCSGNAAMEVSGARASMACCPGQCRGARTARKQRTGHLQYSRVTRLARFLRSTLARRTAADRQRAAGTDEPLVGRCLHAAAYNEQYRTPIDGSMLGHRVGPASRSRGRPMASAARRSLRTSCVPAGPGTWNTGAIHRHGLIKRTYRARTA